MTHEYLRNKFTKAWQFADAHLSRGFSNAKVSEEVKDIREISCHGSEDLNIPPCDGRGDSRKFPGSFVCERCACGDFSHTQLKNLSDSHYSKLDYPRIFCPKQMPGFSNYVPLTISENDMRKKLIEETFGVEYLSELLKNKENSGEQEVE